VLGEPRFARRATKSMGGAERRPRNGFQKIGTSGSGVFIQFRSNLFYQKFLKKSNRSAPPPCRKTALPRKAAGLRLRLAGKKFPPPKPLHFLPARN